MQRSIGSMFAALGLALAASLATAPSVAQSAAPAPARPRASAHAGVRSPVRSTLPSVPALPRVAPPALALSPRASIPVLTSRMPTSTFDEQLASRNALGAAIRELNRLATRQRFGPTDLLEVPPRSPATAGISWLPGGRTGLPPRGMIVAPLPAAPVSAALIPIESTSTMVTDGRGNDAMLLGIQILLPW